MLLRRDSSARDFPSPQCFSDIRGVTARFLCIDLTDLPLLHQAIFTLVNPQGCEACIGRGQARVLALLQCRDNAGSLIALPLCGPSLIAGRSWRGVTIGTHFPCSADTPHNPFRLVRLSKDAVAASLAYLLPEPVEVCFARHDNHDWPGRHLQQDTPSTPGPRLQERGLHFDLGRLGLTSSAQSIPLAEESAFYLHTLGFTITPLRCRRREEGIALTTSLVSNFPHQSGTKNGQHLRLQVILTDPRPDGYARAEFSVANFIHTPESEEADTVLPQGCGHPPRHIIQKVPHVDHDAEVRIVELRTQPNEDQHDRMRAGTIFVIPVDSKFGKLSEREGIVRHLRFRLTEYDREPRFGMPHLTSNLLLSIELSGVFMGRTLAVTGDNIAI